MKVVDIDKLFEKYISAYVYKNIGKVKADEIEDKIPKLYEKFGKAELKELDGKTPETFYDGYAMEELLACLKEHIATKTSVSDFLCEAIIRAKDGSALYNALNQDESEEFTAYCMNFLHDRQDKIPVSRYFEFALLDYPDTIGELATEYLEENAEDVSDYAIAEYENASDKGKERIADILSRGKRSDKAFDILTKEFASHTKEIALYSSYLSRYGDDRAIPILTETAKNEKISYADFQELRFAIESLGGECDIKRDFSNDKTYKRIKGASKEHKHI